MKKNNLFLCSALLLAFLFAPLGVSAEEKARMSDAEMIRALERIFAERPDLVINVLRKHSELVLDIAQEGSTKRRKRSLEAQWRKDRAIDKDVTMDGRPIWGDKDAPITVVEFSDFTCPYCQQAAESLKLIMEEYGGKVRLLFKHTPLSSSPISIMASEYVIAAGYQSETKAKRLYEAIFSQRARLLEVGEPFLQETAEKLGLNVKKLAQDAGSKRTKNIIEQDLKDAEALGVEGTPYFLVNNLVIRGALPYELFKAAFDFELSKQ